MWFSKKQKTDPDVFYLGDREYRLTCTLEEDAVFLSIMREQLAILLKTNIKMRQSMSGKKGSTMHRAFERTLFYNFVGNDFHFLYQKKLWEKFKNHWSTYEDGNEIRRCTETFNTIAESMPSRALEARLGRFYKVVHEVYGGTTEEIEKTADEVGEWYWIHQYNMENKRFLFNSSFSFQNSNW